MRVQQAGFVNRDMTTQAAHKWQCSEQRALCGVTTRLQSNRSPLEHMGVLRDTQNFKFYDIKSIRSQKMSSYTQQTILTFAVGFFDSCLGAKYILVF